MNEISNFISGNLPVDLMTENLPVLNNFKVKRLL